MKQRMMEMAEIFGSSVKPLIEDFNLVLQKVFTPMFIRDTSLI